MQKETITLDETSRVRAGIATGSVAVANDVARGSSQKNYEEFDHLHFEKNSTNLLISSLIAYCRDWVAPEENHFGTLLRLLDMAQVKENDENYKSPLDVLFDEIETGWHYRPDGREVPSLLRNNTTGRMPGMLRVRPDGTFGRGLMPSEDPALALYKGFRATAYRAPGQHEAYRARRRRDRERIRVR